MDGGLIEKTYNINDTERTTLEIIHTERTTLYIITLFFYKRIRSIFNGNSMPFGQ